MEREKEWKERERERARERERERALKVLLSGDGDMDSVGSADHTRLAQLAVCPWGSRQEQHGDKRIGVSGQ